MPTEKSRFQAAKRRLLKNSFEEELEEPEEELSLEGLDKQIQKYQQRVESCRDAYSSKGGTESHFQHLHANQDRVEALQKEKTRLLKETE